MDNVIDIFRFVKLTFILSIILTWLISWFFSVWCACEWFSFYVCFVFLLVDFVGGDPRVVVSTAAFHARVRGLFPGLKETKTILPHSLVKVSIVGNLRDRKGAFSASDLQGLNFEFCVWRRTVSSHLSHHPQEVLLAQFSLYVHKSGLKWLLFPFLPSFSPLESLFLFHHTFFFLIDW